MGLKIEYEGKLQATSSIQSLIEDMRALCQENGWSCWTCQELRELGAEVVQDLRGISIAPLPGQEALHLHVDDTNQFLDHDLYQATHQGLMSELFAQLLEQATSPEQPQPDDPRTCNWITTQAGGPALHKSACLVLMRVKEKFSPDLVVRDDAGYFEHQDEVKLQKLFALAGDQSAQVGAEHSLSDFIHQLQAQSDH